MDGGDADRGGVRGAVETDGSAVPADRSFVRLVDAGDDLDEGRFAGAVGSDESVDFPRADAEIDARKRPNSAERFADAGELETEFARGRHVFGRNLAALSTSTS